MRAMIAALLILTACAAPSGPPTRTDAIGACERFVREQLASPTTAKFSSVQETSAFDSESSNFWRIKGWVDSQNVFGAMTRADYDCSVRFMGRTSGASNWTRENITVTQR